MFCLLAGTTVFTVSGKKAIESIHIGDTLPCVDHITGESAEKRVVTTTVNKVDRLIELTIDGEIIQCTETHPFQVKGRGWVDASELTPGDVVYTKDWDTATVNSVNLLELDETIEVFNFEVEDCHTYFVGDGLWLVHNLCKGNWSKGSYDTPAQSAQDHFLLTMFLVSGQKKHVVDGFTSNVYRYKHAGKYVDLVDDGFEHLIVSFGKVF